MENTRGVLYYNSKICLDYNKLDLDLAFYIVQCTGEMQKHLKIISGT